MCHSGGSTEALTIAKMESRFLIDLTPSAKVNPDRHLDQDPSQESA